MSTFSRKPDQLESLAQSNEAEDQKDFFHVATPWSNAVVSLQGGRILQFQKKNEPPLLFLSKKHHTQGIIHHGGVPLCFPWFGDRPGEKEAHGFARDAYWKLEHKAMLPDQRVAIDMSLPPEEQDQRGWPPVLVTVRTVVGESLELFCKVCNNSENLYTYEACFHAYLHVGEISQASVEGLQGVHYLDKLDQFQEKEEENKFVSFSQKNDRIYLNTAAIPEITVHDPVLKRKMVLQRKGLNTTVVWNPSAEEAKQFPDIFPEDYRYFLCVEGGLMHAAQILQPGEEHEMELVIRSELC
jgi:glucose-6-phosphate 1-epimerase